jgi:hypothetical protein
VGQVAIVSSNVTVHQETQLIGLELN